MSINTAHANNGVLIHAGEYILLFSENVNMEFSDHSEPILNGQKSGKIYLTTHRMIFNNKQMADNLKSFSFPFICLSEVTVEQPVFGANYIKGKVTAQVNGEFNGTIKFKLYFKSGGAIDFASAMLRAASMASRNYSNPAPPPYTPPQGGWYAAPPPAYTPNPTAYGWVPTNVFPNGPAPNTVFMHDSPPPYPGIFGPGAGPQGPSVYPTLGPAGLPPNYGQSGPMGFAPSFGPSEPPAYNPNGPSFQPAFNPNAPSVPPTYNPNGQPTGPSGFNGGMPQTQQWPTPSYPSAPAANWNGAFAPPMGGFGTQPSMPNSKEAEAAQSAYYDPNKPQTAYVPPPAYYEQPPSYNSVNKKEQ